MAISNALPAAERHRRVWLIAAVVVIVVLAVGGLRASRSDRGVTVLQRPPVGSITALPALGHVWVIVLENQSYGDIVGAPEAPYLNDLIARSGLATAYQGVAHPSQPNYLAMFSGSTQGVTDNDPHDLDAPTLADQLEAAGRSWRVFAENVPAGCSTATLASGGADGTGDYVRKHEPAISFRSISGDPTRCADIQPFAAFDPAAADLSFVIPNMCHDMHDCDVAAGDAWLESFVPRILDSAAWHDRGVLIVTFDESDESSTTDNHLATVVSSPLVQAGTTSSVPHNHFSLLRTIQAGFGLDCLAESCTANTLGEFFDSP
jgi:hypothetical protein